MLQLSRCICHVCILQLAVGIILIASLLCMQELPAAEGMFGVTNDGPLMRRVCDELAKAPAHTALESDVKAALSFTRKARLKSLGDDRVNLSLFFAPCSRPRKDVTAGPDSKSLDFEQRVQNTRNHAP